MIFTSRNVITIIAAGVIVAMFFLLKAYFDEQLAVIQLVAGSVVLLGWYLITPELEFRNIDSARFVAGSRRKRTRSDRDEHYKRFCYKAMYGSDSEKAGMEACGYPIYTISQSGLWYETAKPGDVAVFTCDKTDSVTVMIGKTVYHQRWNVSTTNTCEWLTNEIIPDPLPSAPAEEYQSGKKWRLVDEYGNQAQPEDFELTWLSIILALCSTIACLMGYFQALEAVYTIILGAPTIPLAYVAITKKIAYYKARARCAFTNYGEQAKEVFAQQVTEAAATAKKQVVDAIDIVPKMITGTVVLAVVGAMSVVYRIYYSYADKKESKKKDTLFRLHNMLDGALLVVTMAKLTTGNEKSASQVWRKGKFYLAMLTTAIRATQLFSGSQSGERAGLMSFVKATSKEATSVVENVESLDELSATLVVDEEKHDLPGCDCDTRFGQTCHCDLKEDNKDSWTGIRAEFKRIEAKGEPDNDYFSTCRLFVKEHPELILMAGLIVVVATKMAISYIKTPPSVLNRVVRVDRVRVHGVSWELRKKNKGSAPPKRGAKRTNGKTAWVMYDKDGTAVGSIDAGDERRNMAIQKWISSGKDRVTYNDLTDEDQDLQDVDYTQAKNNPLLAFFEDDEGNTAPLPPTSRPRKPRKENAVKKHKKALNRERRAAQKKTKKAKGDEHEVSLKAPSFSVQASQSLVTITNTETGECMNGIKLCNKLVTMRHLFDRTNGSEHKYRVTFPGMEDFILPSHGWYPVGNDLVAHDCPAELRNITSAKVARDITVGEDVCVMAYNVGGSGHLTTSCGKVTSIASLTRDQEKAYGSASTVRGNCGAPWLNKHGHVVGLHSTGSASGNGFIPITQVVKSRIGKCEDTAMPDFR